MSLKYDRVDMGSRRLTAYLEASIKACNNIMSSYIKNVFVGLTRPGKKQVATAAAASVTGQNPVADQAIQLFMQALGQPECKQSQRPILASSPTRTTQKPSLNLNMPSFQGSIDCPPFEFSRNEDEAQALMSVQH